MISTDCHAADDRRAVERAARFSAARIAHEWVRGTLRDAERQLSNVTARVDGRVRP